MKNAEFATFISSLRKMARLQRNEVVSRLGLPDTSEVVAWEMGTSLPSEKILSQLAELYGLPFRELRDVWESASHFS